MKKREFKKKKREFDKASKEIKEKRKEIETNSVEFIERAKILLRIDKEFGVNWSLGIESNVVGLVSLENNCILLNYEFIEKKFDDMETLKKIIAFSIARNCFLKHILEKGTIPENVFFELVEDQNSILTKRSIAFANVFLEMYDENLKIFDNEDKEWQEECISFEERIREEFF